MPLGTGKFVLDMGTSSGSQPIVLKSLRTCQIVLILVNSFSLIWSNRTHLVNSSSLFGQLVLILVSSCSFWSSRTHGSGQFVLILGPLFWKFVYCTQKEMQNKRMQYLKTIYCCEILNFGHIRNAMKMQDLECLIILV